jgi:hypothetical protein
VGEAARDERESTARIDPFQLARAQRLFHAAIDAHPQSSYLMLQVRACVLARAAAWVQLCCGGSGPAAVPLVPARVLRPADARSRPGGLSGCAHQRASAPHTDSDTCLSLPNRPNTAAWHVAARLSRLVPRCTPCCPSTLSTHFGPCRCGARNDSSRLTATGSLVFFVTLNENADLFLLP